MIRARLAAFLSSRKGIQSIAVLSGGTLVSQAIGFIGGAVQARWFYPPEAQDLQASFASLVAALTPALTLRYETAVLLAKDREEAKLACWLCFVIVVATVLLASIVILILNVAGCHFPAVYIVLPAVLLLQGCTQVLTAWCTREGAFWLQSLQRILQSLFMVIFAVGLFLARGSMSSNLPIALTSTLSVGFAAGALVLMRRGGWPWCRPFPPLSRLLELGRQYSRLPLFNLPMNFIDSGSLAIFVWILGQMGTGVSACYCQALALLRAPMALMGAAVAQVYGTKAARLVAQPKLLLALTRQTAIGLTMFAAVLVAAIMTLGPALFKALYGYQWALAGEFSRFLVWGIASTLIYSPLSLLPTILHQNASQMLLIVLLGCARVGVAFASLHISSTMFLVIGSSALELIFNLLLVGLVFRSILKRVDPRSL